MRTILCLAVHTMGVTVNTDWRGGKETQLQGGKGSMSWGLWVMKGACGDASWESTGLWSETGGKVKLETAGGRLCKAALKCVPAAWEPLGVLEEGSRAGQRRGASGPLVRLGGPREAQDSELA